MSPSPANVELALTASSTALTAIILFLIFAPPFIIDLQRTSAAFRTRYIHKWYRSAFHKARRQLLFCHSVGK
jgi:hypothetical protein